MAPKSRFINYSANSEALGSFVLSEERVGDAWARGDPVGGVGELGFGGSGQAVFEPSVDLTLAREVDAPPSSDRQHRPGGAARPSRPAGAKGGGGGRVIAGEPAADPSGVPKKKKRRVRRVQRAHDEDGGEKGAHGAQGVEMAPGEYEHLAARRRAGQGVGFEARGADGARRASGSLVARGAVASAQWIGKGEPPQSGSRQTSSRKAERDEFNNDQTPLLLRAGAPDGASSYLAHSRPTSMGGPAPDRRPGSSGRVDSREPSVQPVAGSTPGPAYLAAMRRSGGSLEADTLPFEDQIGPQIDLRVASSESQSQSQGQPPGSREGGSRPPQIPGAAGRAGPSTAAGAAGAAGQPQAQAHPMVLSQSLARSGSFSRSLVLELDASRPTSSERARPSHGDGSFGLRAADGGPAAQAAAQAQAQASAGLSASAASPRKGRNSLALTEILDMGQELTETPFRNRQLYKQQEEERRRQRKELEAEEVRQQGERAARAAQAVAELRNSRSAELSGQEGGSRDGSRGGSMGSFAGSSMTRGDQHDAFRALQAGGASDGAGAPGILSLNPVAAAHPISHSVPYPAHRSPATATVAAAAALRTSLRASFPASVHASSSASAGPSRDSSFQVEPRPEGRERARRDRDRGRDHGSGHGHAQGQGRRLEAPDSQGGHESHASQDEEARDQKRHRAASGAPPASTRDRAARGSSARSSKSVKSAASAESSASRALATPRSTSSASAASPHRELVYPDSEERSESVVHLPRRSARETPVLGHWEDKEAKDGRERSYAVRSRPQSGKRPGAASSPWAGERSGDRSALSSLYAGMQLLRDGQEEIKGAFARVTGMLLGAEGLPAGPPVPPVPPGYYPWAQPAPFAQAWPGGYPPYSPFPQAPQGMPGMSAMPGVQGQYVPYAAYGPYPPYGQYNSYAPYSPYAPYAPHASYAPRGQWGHSVPFGSPAPRDPRQSPSQERPEQPSGIGRASPLPQAGRGGHAGRPVHSAPPRRSPGLPGSLTERQATPASVSSQEPAEVLAAARARTSPAVGAPRVSGATQTSAAAEESAAAAAAYHAYHAPGASCLSCASCAPMPPPIAPHAPAVPLSPGMMPAVAFSPPAASRPFGSSSVAGGALGSALGNTLGNALGSSALPAEVNTLISSISQSMSVTEPRSIASSMRFFLAGI